jgi:hypothetical protein
MRSGPAPDASYTDAVPWTPPPGFVEREHGIWVPQDYRPTKWELQATPVRTPDDAIAEYVKCAKSLRYFALVHCWSLHVDDAGGDPIWRKFPAYDYLVDFFDFAQVPANCHVEKSRRMLMSWAWMVVFLWDISFHRNWGNMVLSRKETEVDDGGRMSTHDSLLGKIRHLHWALPPYLQAPLNIQFMSIRHPAINSYVRGETATTKAGRGRGVKRALMDEAAYIDNGESIFKGLRQAARSGTCLTSTPNGKGNVFARIRFSAITTFKKYSFHWTGHPEKVQDAYCTCGWKADMALAMRPLEQFKAHDCGNLKLEPPRPPEIRSPWYDRECQDLTPEGVASELDISYERSRHGRVYAAFDSSRHGFDHLRRVSERWGTETVEEYRQRYLRSVLEPHKPCIVTWDFGVGDPTSLLLGQVMDDAQMSIRWLDELEKDEQSWEFFYAFVQAAWAPVVREMTGLDLMHYGDPAGKQRASDLSSWVKNLASREPRIIVIHAPRIGGPLEWIDFVHNLIRRGQFEVSLWCTHLIDALNNYHFPVDDQGNTIAGAQMPVHDIWSHACFVADTPVTTRRGRVAIAHVRVGDEVLTRDGWKTVLASGVTRRRAKTIRVTFSDGRVLVGTPDHRIWTETRGWVRLCELHYEDTFCESTAASTVAPQPCATEPAFVVSICQSEHADVYDLTVEGAHEFFANGVLVHNCTSLYYGYMFRYHFRLTDVDRRGMSAAQILRMPDDTMVTPKPPVDSGSKMGGRGERLKYF